MNSKKALAAILTFSTVCSSLVYAQNSGMNEYNKEYARITKIYSNIMKGIEAAKNADEWDIQFHKLQDLVGHPGDLKYSNVAMCAHLKSIGAEELEYVGSIIESESSQVSLKECRPELLNKIHFASKFRRASFDLDSDIQNIRPLPFEERELDESRDRFSFEGLGPKEVMLTFDDGPRASTTPRVLAALKQAGVKAAFFNLGGNALSNPSLVKRVLSEGHILGSHTYRHTLMMALNTRCGEIPYDHFLSEMIAGHVGVFEAGKYIDPYFRFPNGDADQDMRRNIKELGLKDFRWNVDTQDWQFSSGSYPDVEARRQAILKSFVKDLKGEGKPAGLRDRGIVLFHDIHAQTVDALPVILNYLADNGYKVVLLTPSSRQSPNQQSFPLVTQAKEYLSRHRLSLTAMLPPANTDGQAIMKADFVSKVDFFDMFPQMTRPELVPVGKAQCAAEAAERKAKRAK